MVSTAFKIELTDDKFPSTGPYISFVGKIYSGPKQDDNDCVFGINVVEYNNFNFTNKGKINFKVQVVYESGPDSRFRKLTPKLEIGKLIFIAGLLDLSDDNLPFVEAKEIDFLEDSAISDRQNTSSQSLFSRTQKFKKAGKNISIKKEKSSQEDNEEKELKDDKEELKDDEIEYESGISSSKQSGKRKSELADLSLQRLKKAKNLDKSSNKEFDMNNNEIPSQPTKCSTRKKGPSSSNKLSNKTTKVTTRSQDKKELIVEDSAEYITE
jgi:hypothetical protein